jgi:protein SCO1/2
LTGAFRVLAACLALSLTPHANAGDADGRPLPADSVYQVDAVLTRAGGGPVAWRSLRGMPRVVTMFYSSCRAVCPMIVESARAVQRGLPEQDRARVGFVLVTMDPARDTPETLAKVQRERHLDLTSWTLIQPAAADVRSLAAILGVRYRALADGEFNHTTTLVLLDAEGRVLARTEKIGAAGDPEFVDAARAAAAAR